MGKNFCRALVKFSEPAVYRDALREVEERLNGNTHPISKSNYSMQLDAYGRAQLGGAQSTVTTTSQQMRGATAAASLRSTTHMILSGIGTSSLSINKSSSLHHQSKQNSHQNNGRAAHLG